MRTRTARLLHVSCSEDILAVGALSFQSMPGLLARYVLSQFREDAHPSKEPTQKEVTSMSAEDNKAVIRHLIDRLNQKDVDILDEVCTPDFVSHDPANPQVRSREEFKQWFAAMTRAFPDLHFTLEDIVAEGDRVAYRYTLHATHTGSWRGAPPTGKPITTTAMALTRFRDGKSAELWQNTDALGLVQQLGLIPTPGQASQ